MILPINVTKTIFKFWRYRWTTLRIIYEFEWLLNKSTDLYVVARFTKFYKALLTFSYKLIIKLWLKRSDECFNDLSRFILLVFVYTIFVALLMLLLVIN